VLDTFTKVTWLPVQPNILIITNYAGNFRWFTKQFVSVEFSKHIFGIIGNIVCLLYFCSDRWTANRKAIVSIGFPNLILVKLPVFPGLPLIGYVFDQQPYAPLNDMELGIFHLHKCLICNLFVLRLFI